MKTVLIAFATLAVLAAMPAQAADEDAIKVNIEKSGYECHDCVYVTVTARTDNIQIDKIDVNRGRCPQLKQGKTTYNGKTTPEGWWPNKGTFTPPQNAVCRESDLAFRKSTLAVRYLV